MLFIMPYHRILAIINPVSGLHDPQKTRDVLHKRLKQEGLEYDLRETEGEGDAFRWAEGAEHEGFDLVVVSGGDGTVMEAMSGLIKAGDKAGGKAGSNVPLAQLPVGTSSLFARALKIPLDLGEALDVALTGQRQRLDVGYLPDHERYFALVAGAGWDARLIEDAPRTLKRRLGFIAYVFSGLKNLFTLRRTHIKLTIDGQTREFRAHTVMTANIGQIGDAGVALGPNIHPHDGKLNLIIISSNTIPGILGLLTRLVLRRFTGYRGLEYVEAETLEIDATPPLPVQIDGEPLGTTPLRARVVPDGALVIVPEAYAAEVRELKAEA